MSIGAARAVVAARSRVLRIGSFLDWERGISWAGEGRGWEKPVTDISVDGKRLAFLFVECVRDFEGSKESEEKKRKLLFKCFLDIRRPPLPCSAYPCWM